MNEGERNELLCKLYLVYMRDNNMLLNGTHITSVGFDQEYGQFPLDEFDKIPSMSNENLQHLASKIGIEKAGVFDKSDVYINNAGYSLKSQSAAPPAIINHTSRPKFESHVCKYTKVCIHELDQLIDQYWNLRIQGIISEDTKNSDLHSPFRNKKDILKPIIEYFLFVGSGTRISPHPADFILEYLNPCDSSTWKILTPSDAVDALWDKLVFSIRAKKGMPKNYDMKTYSKPDALSIARWTRYHDGEYRGALHVRATR